MLHEGGKTGGSRLPRPALAEQIGVAESLPQYVTAHPVPRTACVGCGYWGKKVARNLASLNALHAASDISLDALGEVSSQYAVPGVSFDAILADPDCDAVAIASPAALHGDHVRRALLAGKHVFVEKPLALRLFEGHALVKLARDRGRILMVGHLLRYHPIVVALVEHARSGRLGAIKHVYSRRFGLGKIRTEEDVIWSFAPHDISMILALIGETPNYVSAEATSIVTTGIADIANIHLGFPGGVTGRISVSWLNPTKEQRTVIIGSAAHAVFDDTLPWEQKLQIYDHRIHHADNVPSVTRAEPILPAVAKGEPLREELAHFLHCVATGRPPLTDGAEALGVLSVLEQAAKSVSAKNGH
ncbi:MAG TPA: Gfo/Idh/MocA family oxidoreductase [Rhizomicrobium sp.]|jgi:UDP-2-acetamido-3-amino-2,3-dideoxy-glucuronate N-acetyltransferase|nr:Gfo/Idh/MocA family oxidoreductase [Rhizomicrobium sp.]